MHWKHWKGYLFLREHSEKGINLYIWAHCLGVFRNPLFKHQYQADQQTPLPGNGPVVY